VLSRLTVDSSIVGERYGIFKARCRFLQVLLAPTFRTLLLGHFLGHSSSHIAFCSLSPLPHSITQNLSDGLRAVVMAGVGCASPSLRSMLPSS
jgi:hypothetical protein